MNSFGIEGPIGMKNILLYGHLNIESSQNNGSHEG